MRKLQKSKDKYEALLKATLELINSGGVQAASMAKVAKQANVSPATIYIYFQNKQDLVNELYLSVKKSFTDYSFSSIDEKKTIEDNFKDIWFNMMHYKTENLAHACFLSQCDNTPMIDEHVKEKGLEYIKPLLDIWEQGIKDGIIKDVSPYVLYGFSIYPMAFLIKLEKTNLIEMNEKTINDAYTMAWNSIKA